MIDTFPLDATEASRRRALGLMAESDAGPSLLEHLRDLCTTGDGGPQRRRIALSALRQVRDLTSTAATAGGHLIGTTMSPLEAMLRRYGVVGGAGVTYTTNLDGPAVIPRVGIRPDAAWLATDGATIPQAEPTLGQVAVAPKFLAIRMRVSRQLLLQGAAEALVSDVAGDAIGRGTDEAIFSGTGASGQPLGLVGTAGVHAQSGTSLALAGLLNMREQVLLAGAREDRLVWFGHPGVQELLGGRERHSGGGRTLWDDNGILGRPAYATTAVPAGTLVLCDPARITVSIFSGGASLETDPYTDFMTGKVSYRLILPVDFAFSPAAAFAVATSIT